MIKHLIAPVLALTLAACVSVSGDAVVNFVSPERLAAVCKANGVATNCLGISLPGKPRRIYVRRDTWTAEAPYPDPCGGRTIISHELCHSLKFDFHPNWKR